MCLAIPGKILEMFDRDGLPMASVAFGGITRETCLECVPQAKVGDYVLVHVGMALGIIDEQEAARTFALLAELGELAELGGLGELDTPQAEDEPT